MQQSTRSDSHAVPTGADHPSELDRSPARGAEETSPFFMVGQVDPITGGDWGLYQANLTYTDTLHPNGITVTGDVLSVGTTNATLGYTAGYEYWRLPQEFRDALAGTNRAIITSLVFNGSGGTWSGADPLRGAPTAWMMTRGSGAPNPGWTQMTSSPPKSFLTGSSTAGYVMLLLDYVNNLTKWYRSGQGGTTVSGFAITSGQTMFNYSVAPALPTGYSWFRSNNN